MDKNYLYEKIDHLPQSPGVYLMKGVNSEILYVGKAINLKKRVKSYFQKDHENPKTESLVRFITDIDVILVSSEVEALILERSLIKHHKPKFNIVFTDDKEYPFLKIDTHSPWPRITKVRKTKIDNCIYIGPFARVKHMHTMLRMVYKIFPLIRCSENEFQRRTKPCHYYHMKRCLAPCTLPVDKNLYLETMQEAIKFLKGEDQSIQKDLSEKMTRYAEEENFERAALYRDQLKAFETVTKKQAVHFPGVRELDAIGFALTENYIAFSILIVRNEHIINQEDFHSPRKGALKEEVLSLFLLQFYENRDIPKEILLPFWPEGADSLTELLSITGHNINQIENKLSTKTIRFIMALEDKTKNLLAHAQKNAEFQLEEYIKEQIPKNETLLALKEFLHLKKIPKRIECIDISNLQDKDIVASVVCFVDGKPSKKNYRHYQIRTVLDKPDDFSSIFEVVVRRLRRGLKEQIFPDLLVIDGGKGQLSRALQAFSLFENLPEIPTIGLIKSRTERDPFSSQISISQEQVVIPGDNTPLPIETGSLTYQILTQLRDEAHRFAISYHRKKRSHRITSSSLEEIPGVGPKIRKNLLLKFSNLEVLKNASLSEIEQTQGVSKKLAAAIWNKFHSKDNAQGPSPKAQDNEASNKKEDF